MHASQQVRQPCRTPTPAGHAAPHKRHPTSRQQQQQQRRGGGVLVQAKPGDVLLVAEGISKTYDGEKQLFGNLTFTVTAGTKLAIVGPNGAGKSTLLKILGKKDQHDAGLISRKEGALVGYLPQSDLMELEQQPQQQPQQQAEGGSSGDMTVLQAVLESDSQVAKVVQTYQSALSDAGGSITPALEAAIEAMNTHSAWGLDSEARAKLEAVGLTDPDAKVSSLSGGQRRRLSLAAALLGNPDLLILDEPTNHMDAAMIAWMEDEIRASPDMAVVMVSHDRAFMESCCSQLLELDHGGFTSMHPFGGHGSYEAFKEARAARRAAQASAAADARTVLRRESEWMARQPKARSTKAKARVDAFSELQERARDTPPPDVKPDFGRVAMLRLGNKAVELVNVTLTTPDGSRQLLRDFSFEFSPGARIGIAGPNGAGKSSLLDVVAGLRQPQSGRVDVGETAVIGYFQQHPPPVPDSLRLIDYIRDVAEKRKARKGDSGLTGPVDIPEVLLEKLGFPRKTQFQKVGSLSGGERRRLHLAAVLAATPNVLLLDEPTNDLDLGTVEVLEEVLGAYRGLLLVVSHDRAFMEGATSDLLVLPGDGSVVRHSGKYSDYLRERQQAAAAAAAQQQQQQLRRTMSNGAASTSSSNTSSNSSSNGNGSKPAGSSGGTASKPAAAAAAAASKGGSSNGSSKAAKTSSSKRTLGLFERQEYEKLGKDMADLEAQLKRGSDRLNALNSSGAAWADIEALSLELAGLQAAYDAKEERWFELAEIAGDL